MPEQTLTISRFDGAIATTSEKVDIPNACRFSKGLNPFSDPSFITLSRKATKKSSTTVVGLPHWWVDGSPWSTNRYVYDSGGNIYTVDSDDAFTNSREVSGGAGEGLLVFDNYLYYAQATELGRYGPLDGTPAFQDSFSGWWISTQLQDTGGGTGAADYVPPTSISEAATARQTLTAVKDPIVSITIDVDVVGSGNWTVTLHDTANNSIGSKTIANGSMATGDVTFTFASVLRVESGKDYHFHVTSTVADGGVDTSTATNLEAAEYTVQYGTLISTTFHPIVHHLNLLAIGNERYIATYDKANYYPNKIILPAGFTIRAMAKTDEYVVAEAFKGSTLREAEAAKRFYWDGISSTFNFSTDITVGACNALSTSNNQLLGVYGHKGAVYRSSAQAELEENFAKIPKLARGKYVEVYPGAIAEYEGNTLIGYAAGTDDTTGFEQGVYDFGSEDSKLPKVLNMSYLLSTLDTQGTNVKVSMVTVFGKDIYIGGQTGATTYEVSKIALGDSALAAGSWESLIFDGGSPDHNMQAIKVVVTFEALTIGQSVTAKHKLDRTASFTTGTAASTVGDTEAKVFINTVCKEAEFGFDLASTSNTFPKITSVSFVFDPLDKEA